jgi:DNA-binding NarL/FixJ family response regulator
MSERSVLILDSGEVGWAAVRAALQERDDIRIIGEARTHDSALFYASTHRIDLLLASDRLAGASSYLTLAELRATSCQDSLIALFVNAPQPAELERFGQLEVALAWRWDELHTTDAIDPALAAILTGDLIVGTRKIVRDYFYIGRGTTREAHHAIKLSDLDRQILSLLAEGLNSKEIGPLVSRAPKTVENRLEGLKRILGAKNRPHLVHLAHRLNLMGSPDDKPTI